MGRPTMNGKRGHILLIALVLATVSSIMLGMVIQPIRNRHQRLKEQETIYRGEHLAEGIRRFYFKYRRFPYDLDELVESDPRLVRKLYTDPMNPDGEWVPVYLNKIDAAVARGMLRSLQGLVDNQTGERDQQNDGPGLQDEGGVFDIKTQQITGIHSASEETGLTEYHGSRIYSDWLFTALPQPEDPIETLRQRK